MKITEMLPEHVDAVKALLDLCFADGSWSVASIRSELDKPDSRCTVAVEDGEVIGFLAFEQIVDEGSVVEVAVMPAYRRHGVARKMIERATEDAADLRNVFLEVRQGNAPALALYDSLGFERIAVRKDYYDKPKENAVIMRKSYENTGYREQL